VPPGNGDADIGPEPGSDRAVKYQVANRFQGSLIEGAADIQFFHGGFAEDLMHVHVGLDE
jgi:hypothetical protein